MEVVILHCYTDVMPLGIVAIVSVSVSVMGYLHSQMQIPILIPVPIPFLGWESESKSVQCEKFCIVQCGHLVCSPNRKKESESGFGNVNEPLV